MTESVPTAKQAPRAREQRLQRTYGITQADYARMYLAQGGSTTLCIDHDHRTGEVRGLLCHHCNRAVGNMKDNPVLLERAAQYLRAPRST